MEANNRSHNICTSPQKLDKAAPFSSKASEKSHKKPPELKIERNGFR